MFQYATPDPEYGPFQLVVADKLLVKGIEYSLPISNWLIWR
jgi:hypothetical protein